MDESARRLKEVSNRHLKKCVQTYPQSTKTNNAWFHIWSTVAHDDERGGIISVGCAIIELEDGQVKTVPPDQIKFVDWS